MNAKESERGMLGDKHINGHRQYENKNGAPDYAA